MRTIVRMLLGWVVFCTAVSADAAPARGEGHDIVELVQQKKIEAKARGAGIDSVSLELRRPGTQDLTVRIPVGTFFVAQHAAAQNMVTTEDKTVVLRSNGWVSVHVPAACANQPREIPSSEDRFDIRRSPEQHELQQLMPILHRAKAPSAVRQAAVWIVTDNADYDDLGTLVESFGPIALGGTRVIKEYEAARAMKICDEAGIDITRKAIWRDRKAILKGLKDASLRQWLQERGRR